MRAIVGWLACETYCTSTSRLRSRIYLPSLYFWDGSYALSCVQYENRKKKIWRCNYIFPTKGSATFAAVNISDGVVARGHWAVIRFAFNDIYTRDKWCVSNLDDRTLRQWMTYTPSKRYARPCCPLKAWPWAWWDTTREKNKRKHTRDIIEWMVARWVLHVAQP